MPKDLFHFDLVNLGAMFIIAIVAWVTMRNTLIWHTAWIKKHDKECDELREKNKEMLTQILITNEHLRTLAGTNAERLDRTYDEIIGLRTQANALASEMIRKR